MSDIEQGPNANICLTFNNKTGILLTGLAQENFVAISEGYCLGEGVFPHITLGQIYVDSEDQKTTLKKNLAAMPTPPAVSFSGLYANFKRDGFLWCGFNVNPSPELSAFQEQIDSITKSIGLTLFNPSLSEYWPHTTLARILERTPVPSFLIPQNIIDMQFETTLLLGPSDKNGQLLGLDI